MKLVLPSIIIAGLFLAQMANALPGDRYVGFTVGQAWTTQDLEGQNGLPSLDTNGNEWNVAAVAGIAWNGTRGSYIGIEGELEVGFENTDQFSGADFNGDNVSYAAGIYGRAGWWFWSSVLVYGKAGVKQSYIDFSDGDGGSFSSIEVGLGAEYIINEQWTIRAEYAHEWATDSDSIFEDYDLSRSKNNVSIGVMRHF